MITVYSTPSCQFCNMLKNVYKTREIEFEEKLIGVDITKEELEALAGTQIRQAPVVFKDGNYVGGYAEGQSLITEAHNDKAAKLQEDLAKELSDLGISL